MNRRKQIVPFLMITVLFSFFYMGNVAAATRTELLARFFKDNQTTNGGFINTNNGTGKATDFTSFANVYALDRLGSLDEIDKDKAKDWFLDRFDISFNSEDIPQTYYAYKAIKILGESINETIKSDGVDAILVLKNTTTNGFASGNVPYANLLDTYYAVEFLYEAGKSGSIVPGPIATFVMSCWVESSAAFSGKPGEEVNPIDSYYAVKTLERLNKLSDLNSSKQTKLDAYIETMYCGEAKYEPHFGGYTYTQLNPYSSITLTFYCLGIQKAISGTTHSQTLTWVLSKQTSFDYGFQEYSIESETKYSSAISSYQAIEIIFALESAPLENSLAENIWELENNPWIMAAIVIGTIGGFIIICVIIYKAKNKV
jgi:prenyltransferase beta subunit